ncbi:MAG: hypothetical protein ABSF76_02840 [Opitutaceae bacterium]
MKKVKEGGHRLFENDPETAWIVSEMPLELKRDRLTAVHRYSGKFDDWMPRNYELGRAEVRQINDRLGSQVVAETGFRRGNVHRFAEAQLGTLTLLRAEIHPGIILGHKHIPVRSITWRIWPTRGSTRSSIRQSSTTCQQNGRRRGPLILTLRPGYQSLPT